MFNHPAGRIVGGILSVALILGTIISWWFPTRTTSEISIHPDFIKKLATVPPEDSSPLLTDIYDALAANFGVQQVLLLQAVPNEAPIVVATMEDSSDEEDATHWPSPWPTVNSALESGSLPKQTTVKGRHAGFDYVHTLVPIDETRSRILLINQAASAPVWGIQRVLLLFAGILLLIHLWLIRG